MTNDDLAKHAQAILDANRYLTMGTVDPDGRPWTSPVYFASAGVREFYWVSDIDARHSRHLAERPQVSVVVFDSTVPPYHGRAVYAVGAARELSDDDLDRGLPDVPRARQSGRHPDNPGGRDRALPVPPLPGHGVGRVGPLPARAPAALPAARSHQGTTGLASSRCRVPRLRGRHVPRRVHRTGLIACVVQGLRVAP